MTGKCEHSKQPTRAELQAARGWTPAKSEKCWHCGHPIRQSPAFTGWRHSNGMLQKSTTRCQRKNCTCNNPLSKYSSGIGDPREGMEAHA